MVYFQGGDSIVGGLALKAVCNHFGPTLTDISVYNATQVGIKFYDFNNNLTSKQVSQYTNMFAV